MTRTPIRLLVLTVASALAAVVLPATAQAAPYCGITWGSTAKTHAAHDREMVNGIRAGRHACFDRMVVDLGGQDVRFGSYDVRYVPLVYADGSGAPVPVRGAARQARAPRRPGFLAEPRGRARRRGGPC